MELETSESMNSIKWRSKSVGYIGDVNVFPELKNITKEELLARLKCLEEGEVITQDSLPKLKPSTEKWWHSLKLQFELEQKDIDAKIFSFKKDSDVDFQHKTEEIPQQTIQEKIEEKPQIDQAVEQPKQDNQDKQLNSDIDTTAQRLRSNTTLVPPTHTIPIETKKRSASTSVTKPRHTPAPSPMLRERSTHVRSIFNSDSSSDTEDCMPSNQMNGSTST